MSTQVEKPLTEESPSPTTPIPWVLLAWCAGLLLLTYLPILIPMAQQWNNDDDMSHGFFVPFAAMYVAWERRQELLAVTPKPSWVGFLLLLWGAAQMAIGMLGAELFFQRSAFLVSMVGAVLLIGGGPLLRKTLFPLAMLCFMIPLPAIVYNRITFPLQLFASAVAEAALSAVGIPVLRDGNVLELASQKLSVVEACSGIRSLMSLAFLSLVYGYWFDEHRVWMRVLVFLSTIPIAIAANSFRVSLTGVMSEYDPELAKGFFHSLEGWVIFVVALTMMVVAHGIFKRLARMVAR